MAPADRYRVERELGTGGMATVCLAQDLKHNRPLAGDTRATSAQSR
jgi:serine/threonine-protein kinase